MSLIDSKPIRFHGVRTTNLNNIESLRNEKLLCCYGLANVETRSSDCNSYFETVNLFHVTQFSALWPPNF